MQPLSYWTLVASSGWNDLAGRRMRTRYLDVLLSICRLSDSAVAYMLLHGTILDNKEELHIH
jgi:hypothetical protein